MKVLLVGSGAREHALAWRLATSSPSTELHAAPGNPGIARLGQCHPIRTEDTEGVVALAGSLVPDLVVIGPEVPLVAGLADELRRAGAAVFGPGAAAARIEGSKLFAKDVMSAAGVLPARELDEAHAPCVIKADGLAAGKGVFVCRTDDEVAAGLRDAAALGAEIVVEELLEGPEVSLFAICDGTRAVPFGSAQDFKRAFDGDEGPNTGGMGAFSPVPLHTDPAELVAQIHQPVIDELARRGAPFVGCLFAGLMLTADGPRVLEFNARFGDPETQVLIPRLEGDLLQALAAAAAGSAEPILFGSQAAVTVVLAGPDYPARSDYSGAVISGVEEAEAGGALVFHGGTATRGDVLVTNGGRILSVTGVGPDVSAARDRAYAAAGAIGFEGVRYRRDVALGVTSAPVRRFGALSGGWIVVRGKDAGSPDGFTIGATEDAATGDETPPGKCHNLRTCALTSRRDERTSGRHPRWLRIRPRADEGGIRRARCARHHLGVRRAIRA